MIPYIFSNEEFDDLSESEKSDTEQDRIVENQSEYDSDISIEGGGNLTAKDGTLWKEKLLAFD